MTRVTTALGLMLMLPLIGCPSEDGPRDSGSDDGGDTDAGRTDGGGTDGGGTDSGDGDDIARCQAASAALAAACPMDGDRTCHAGEYGDFCTADAGPGLYADALECLVAMSGASGCRTFSDPSGADTCVDAVYAGVASPAVDTIVARIATLCPGEPPVQPERTEPPLFALTAAQLAVLQTCLDMASDCMAVGACADATSGGIAACYL